MLNPQLEAARLASSQGRHQQAVDLCLSVLQSNADDATALAFLGLSLWRGAAYPQAVGVLQRALKSFPAQMELSLALLESLQRSGRLDEALAFSETLPEQLQIQAPIASGIEALRSASAESGPGAELENRLMVRISEGAVSEVQTYLEPLLQHFPRWAFGHALAAGLLFNRGGAGISKETLQVPDGLTAAGVQAVWRHRLAEAMAAHRARIMASLDVALAVSPNDLRAARVRARTRFEEGQPLSEAECALVAEESGSRLSEIYPLRSPLDTGFGDAATVRLLQAATRWSVPTPRYVGAQFDVESAVGAVVGSDRYVGEAWNAIVAAGSDVVVLNDGTAMCEPLTHPLGELTRYVSDSWIALGSVKQVILRERPVMQIEGVAISLLGSAARFYGHWMLDFLARLRAIYQHPEAASAQVLVEDDMPESHYDALRFLHGPAANIQRVAPGYCVQVQRLLFAGSEVYFPHVPRFGAPTLPSIAPTSSEGLAFLRERILGGVGVGKRRGSRVFVRRRSGTRCTVNEDELCDELIRDWGFEALEPQTLEFAEQVRRFHDADVVVGAQGSAMSNCVFCAPGTRVIALCSPDAANFPSWADALEQIGLKHCFAVGEAVESSHELAVQRDIVVDPVHLRAALTALGVAPQPASQTR